MYSTQNARTSNLKRLFFDFSLNFNSIKIIWIIILDKNSHFTSFYSLPRIRRLAKYLRFNNSGVGYFCLKPFNFCFSINSTNIFRRLAYKLSIVNCRSEKFDPCLGKVLRANNFLISHFNVRMKFFKSNLIFYLFMLRLRNG